MSASYDKNESISVDGKSFHYTPDRKEFLEGLIGKYPNQTSFTKEEIEDIRTQEPERKTQDLDRSEYVLSVDKLSAAIQ